MPLPSSSSAAPGPLPPDVLHTGLTQQLAQLLPASTPVSVTAQPPSTAPVTPEGRALLLRRNFMAGQRLIGSQSIDAASSTVNAVNAPSTTTTAQQSASDVPLTPDQLAEQRRLRRNLMERQRRQSASPSVDAARRAADAQRVAERRRNESDENSISRRATDAQRTSERRATETESEAARRRAANAMRMAQRRNSVDVTAAAARRELDSQSRASQRQNQPGAVQAARRAADTARHRQALLPQVPVPIGLTNASPDEHYLGRMSDVCSACGAMYFPGEVPARNGTYNICCNFGAVSIDLFSDYPDVLRDLFIGDNAASKNWKENVRQFNSSLAMVSMGAQLVQPPGRGPFAFRIHGQVYHYAGPLHPKVGERPQYGQLYILDTQQAAAERMNSRLSVNCDPVIMQGVSQLMLDINPYANAYKMMGKVALEEAQSARLRNVNPAPMRMLFHVDPTLDTRRYNMPASNEIAAVFVGEGDEVPQTRSFAIHLNTGGLQTLQDIDPLCDTLCYPLFYPTGRRGWHVDLLKNGTTNRRQRVTQREFYSHILAIRRSFNPMLHAGKLFQQFVVDSWVKIEQNRLNYARHHQAELRADTYSGLQDYLADANSTGVPGARIILPSSFQGSARHMQQSYQDAMSIVTRYGKPDYFITMTCNPQWKEIVENLLPGQTASDRPDLVARVFNAKLKKLFHSLLQEHVLGHVQAYISVIEWQKRGLPHCHMLLTMHSQDKPRTVSKVDAAIRAFIPDPATEPRLHSIVSTSMIHRNCGPLHPSSPCMKNGVCSKGFPKDFLEDTHLDADCFPKYRRPDNGRTATLGTTVYNNRHVVPYNAYLSLLINAHINVEICGLIHAIKYLYKYVYKGNDRASLRLQQAAQQAGNAPPVDEIRAHLDARYVCAPEGMHRILEYDCQKKSDTIVRLQIHLPDHQCVVFQPANVQTAVNNAASKDSTLTAWFKLNKDYADAVQDGQDMSAVPDPRQFLYIQIPEHYTFNATSKKWTNRRRESRQIGRMYMVSPKDTERFCLRLLLLNRRGVMSFEDLRTINGVLCSTFCEAAAVGGLLHDDRHFEECMAEAVTFRMPAELRSLFSSLIAFSAASNIHLLWDRFKGDMSEDYQRSGWSVLESEAHAYYDIQDSLAPSGFVLPNTIPPPLPARPVRPNQNGPPPIDHATLAQQMYITLNPLQKKAADDILNARRSTQSRCFYIDGPGGSGKTFLYTALYHLFMGQQKRVLCSAWTGIAANLLPAGRTINSLFRLSIPSGNRISTLKGQSKEARQLRDTEVFIVDECSMVPRWSLDAIDQLLRDVTGNDVLFGGKIFIVGGDFRQVLPVVERGQNSDAVDACMKNSPYFSSFQIHRLRSNMRAQNDADWAAYLLSVGNGEVDLDDEGRIEIPPPLLSNGDLIEEIFEGRFADVDFLSQAAILAPKNIHVDSMNLKILEKLPGQESIFMSIDELESDNPSDAQNYSVEFLHKLNPSGTPPHELKLKKGAIVMLLRNLDVTQGLCNGTRLCVEDFTNRVLKCQFINGSKKGASVLIPRIDNMTEKGLPFTLRRRQFPVRLAFAMTINKAQGQSLDRVGVFLPDDPFAHGHTYVALSRCRTMEGVRVQADAGRMKNIVIKAVL